MQPDLGNNLNDGDASNLELPTAVERLREKIQLGIEQLDRGEGEPLDMDEIRSEIRRRTGQAKLR